MRLNYNISRWDKYGLNYWGIPKCGNTTVKYSLLNPAEHAGPTDVGRWVHGRGTYITPDEALTNGNRNISFIRNPYARFISLYKDFGLRRPKVLAGFAKNPDGLLDKIAELDYFIDIVCANKVRDQHFRTMCSYVARNKQRLFDDIYDVAEIGSVLAEFGVAMQVVNATGDAKISLNDRQKQLIYEKYEQDFLVFGYAG